MDILERSAEQINPRGRQVKPNLEEIDPGLSRPPEPINSINIIFHPFEFFCEFFDQILSKITMCTTLI